MSEAGFKQVISEILPKISNDVLNSLLDRLDEIGIDDLDTFHYLTESDLVPPLKKFQALKLLDQIKRKYSTSEYFGENFFLSAIISLICVCATYIFFKANNNTYEKKDERDTKSNSSEQIPQHNQTCERDMIGENQYNAQQLTKFERQFGFNNYFGDPFDPLKFSENVFSGQNFWQGAGTELMTSSAKPQALLINIWKFSNYRHFRKGADRDSTKLKQLFISLGFQVTILENKTKAEIMVAIINFLHSEKVNEAAISLLFIGSIGQQTSVGDGFFDYNCELVAVDMILNMYRNHNCESKSWRNKPKIFLFNFSRNNYGGCSSRPSFIESSKNYRVNADKNMFVVFSTASDCHSYRSLFLGSRFVDSLCQVLSKEAKRNEIHTLFNMVKVDVLQRNKDKYVQSPRVISTVTKSVYLFSSTTEKSETDIQSGNGQPLQLQQTLIINNYQEKSFK